MVAYWQIEFLGWLSDLMIPIFFFCNTNLCRFILTYYSGGDEDMDLSFFVALNNIISALVNHFCQSKSLSINSYIQQLFVKVTKIGRVILVTRESNLLTVQGNRPDEL
jgi:hypothetical protein